MAVPHHEKERKESSSDSLGGNTEIENTSVNPEASGAVPESVDADQLRANINAKIANPLAGFTHAQLAQKGEEYVRTNNVGNKEDIRAFRLGAILAQDPNRHAEVDWLTTEESEVLSKEIAKKWSQPRLLYLVIVLCSTCAAVQGMGESRPFQSSNHDVMFSAPVMEVIRLRCFWLTIFADETVVNGGQRFYSQQFGISDKNSSRDSWLVGLVNSAPYLCCAFIGCW
jgi:hypothetical protein